MLPDSALEIQQGAKPKTAANKILNGWFHLLLITLCIINQPKLQPLNLEMKVVRRALAQKASDLAESHKFHESII